MLVSRNLLTGGKRAAARFAVVGLSVLTLAAPSALAQATAAVASVTQTPLSSTVLQAAPVTYIVTARDASGAVVAGQAINVAVTVASPVLTQPLTVTGVSGLVAAGVPSAWSVAGTVTTSVAGVASYTVASAAVGSVSVRAYAGTAPFNGSQISAASTQVVTAPGADAVTTFSLAPATDTRVAGLGHVINLTGMAASGVSVVGVTPLGFVTGPNATALVTCTATNAAGASTCSYANTFVGTDSVTIYVNKSTGAGPQLETGELRAVVARITTVVLPVITVPADITLASTSAAGAVVSFTVTSTIGSATCDHLSGATFPVGTTTVVCSAGAGASLVTKSFHVTVTGAATSTVSIVVPERIQVVVRKPATSAVVTFVTSASDSVDGVLALTCDHPSGSVFTKGETRVTCSATNSRGVVATAFFHVVVKVEGNHHERHHGRKHDHKHHKDGKEHNGDESHSEAHHRR